MEHVDERMVMTEQAWAWYNNTMSLGGTRPRNWLPLKKLALIADIIGHEITLEELQVLVQKDGEVQKCKGCGKEFQPVKMVAVDNWLLRQLEYGVGILELEGLRHAIGSFFLSWNSKQEIVSLPFCGGLFYYNPKVKDAEGCEIFATNRQGCIGAVFLSEENRDKNNHPRPTRSKEAVDAIISAEVKKVAERQAKREAEIRLQSQEYQKRRRENREYRIRGVQHALRDAGIRT